MLQRLVILCALVLSGFAGRAALPAPIALSVSVNTNGVLTAPTNFLTANFSTNAFASGSTGLRLAPNLYLTNDWTIISTGSVRSVKFEPVNRFDANAVNSDITASSELFLQGEVNLTVYAGTNFYLISPAVVAGTASTGQILALSSSSTGRAEYRAIEQTVTATGQTVLSAWLRAWAAAQAFTLASGVVRDGDGILTSAVITWPDGSSGTYTLTTKNATWGVPDAYAITHSSSGKTVTQPAVTRDANGNISVQPAITIAP